MDSGPGFDSRLIANAFAPFFTRKQGSAGMGLTICETIIEGHDGRITIGSSSTGGAMVEFFLPVVSDSSELQ
jgi:signal transduction histidine kinase